MMKLLLSSLILTTLCGRLCWSVSSNRLAVIQSPDVSVMEGETVNISCCWTGKIERATVYWLKNRTIIQRQLWQNTAQGSLKKETNNCSPLIFPIIRRNDSGRYICQVYVEIPIFVSAIGTGTLITVTNSERTDDDSDDHNADGVPSDTFVIQSPDVSVMEGETVNISCCWTGKIERATVYWLKKGTIIQRQLWQNTSQGSLKKDTNNCSSLIFQNITRNDSGRYICRVFVDIPRPMERNGTGTLVTVVSLETTDDDAVLPEVYVYIVRCLPILFLVTPLCCLFFYLRTEAQKNTPGSSRYNPRSVQRQEEDEDEV